MSGLKSLYPFIAVGLIPNPADGWNGYSTEGSDDKRGTRLVARIRVAAGEYCFLLRNGLWVAAVVLEVGKCT